MSEFCVKIAIDPHFLHISNGYLYVNEIFLSFFFFFLLSLNLNDMHEIICIMKYDSVALQYPAVKQKKCDAKVIPMQMAVVEMIWQKET